MNYIKSMMLIGVAIMALAGCGTTEGDKADDQTTNGSTTEVAEEETTTEEGTVEVEEDTNENEPKEEEKLYLPEKQLTYTEGKDGNQVENTAFFQQSPNKYIIYTLENFSLEQEEPGKDVILNEQFPEAMLRIEKVDPNATDVEQRINDMANAVSDEILGQETIGLAPWLEGVVWKTAIYEGQQIDFLYIPSKQIIATMFHPKEYTLQGEYLAMLETFEWQ